MILNPNDPSQVTNPLIAFTDGFAYSYICEERSSELDLVLIPRKTTEIISFGHHYISLTSNQETHVVFWCRGVPKEFLLRIVPKISFPINYIIPPSQNPFECLDTSNFPLRTDFPDILIGNNYLYDFHLYSLCKLPSGFHLLDSDVGPILGGFGTLDPPEIPGEVSDTQMHSTDELHTEPSISQVPPSPSLSNNNFYQIQNQDIPPNQPSTSHSVPRTSRVRLEFKFPCLLCMSSSHSASQCSTDLSSRRSILAEKKLCIKCLKRHGPNSCRRITNCEICKEPHHRIVCPNAFPNKNSLGMISGSDYVPYVSKKETSP
ncbi:hypothetical protein DdX_13655 [Ditylenchus destructor]|uniref:DUF1758 domain-containing protein n=1 Tax=Ditylenchus destructor TaxID=166010 RepID=A0AAD4MYF9_9BILA|nr:hypothetical protein DdX_13655 [Ditylenchus destructor]